MSLNKDSNTTADLQESEILTDGLSLDYRLQARRLRTFHQDNNLVIRKKFFSFVTCVVVDPRLRTESYKR